MLDPIARARATWPSLHVPDDVFAAHIAARGEPEALELEDLYLACACLQGVPRALELFDTEVLRRVDPVVRRCDDSEAFVDEVRQQLRQKLFLPPPRIAEYSGRGPLVAWLRAAAARAALNALRPDQRHAFTGADELEALPAVAPDPDLVILRGRHRASFRAAFQGALSSLPQRERTALKLNALDGLSLEKIGAMYQVDKSSVSRWLSHAHEALLAGTRQRLQAELGLGSADVDSLVVALKSQLASSLLHLLAE
jgi:RNA polymerase sigma-70 factor (ECF subfamily)